jgi:hypothetical protein
VVDALRKRAHEMHATTISMYRIDIKYKFSESTNSKEHIFDIMVAAGSIKVYV